jgi:hypothetical protein
MARFIINGLAALGLTEPSILTLFQGRTNTFGMTGRTNIFPRMDIPGQSEVFDELEFGLQFIRLIFNHDD